MDTNIPDDKFEDFFRNKLGDFGDDPPSDFWNNLEAAIPPAPKKGFVLHRAWWLGAAAALVFLFMGWQLWTLNHKVNSLSQGMNEHNRQIDALMCENDSLKMQLTTTSSSEVWVADSDNGNKKATKNQPVESLTEQSGSNNIQTQNNSQTVQIEVADNQKSQNKVNTIPANKPDSAMTPSVDSRNSSTQSAWANKSVNTELNTSPTNNQDVETDNELLAEQTAVDKPISVIPTKTLTQLYCASEEELNRVVSYALVALALRQIDTLDNNPLTTEPVYVQETIEEQIDEEVDEQDVNNPYYQKAWSLGVSGGAMLAGRAVKPAGMMIDKNIPDEKPGLLLQAGLSAYYHINDKLTLGVGLAYAKHQQTTTHHLALGAMHGGQHQPTDYSSNMDNSYGSVELKASIEQVQEDVSDPKEPIRMDVTTKQSFTHRIVPVSMGYTLVQGTAWSVGLSGGLLFDKITSVQGEVTDLHINNPAFRAGNVRMGTPPKPKSMHVWYTAGLNIAYNVTDRVSVYAEPSYASAVGVSVRHDSFSAKPYTAGIQAGVKIRL